MLAILNHVMQVIPHLSNPPDYVCVCKYVNTYIYICIRSPDAYIMFCKGSDTPTVNKIINYKIRDRVAVDWYELGVQLLREDLQVQLDIINRNNPGDVKTCCTEMFKYWLKVDATASWSKLIEALRKINKNHLVASISREILQSMYMVNYIS